MDDLIFLIVDYDESANGKKRHTYEALTPIAHQQCWIHLRIYLLKARAH